MPAGLEEKPKVRQFGTNEPTSLETDTSHLVQETNIQSSTRAHLLVHRKQRGVPQQFTGTLQPSWLDVTLEPDDPFMAYAKAPILGHIMASGSTENPVLLANLFDIRASSIVILGQGSSVIPIGFQADDEAKVTILKYHLGPLVQRMVDICLRELVGIPIHNKRITLFRSVEDPSYWSVSIDLTLKISAQERFDLSLKIGTTLSLFLASDHPDASNPSWLHITYSLSVAEV